MATRKASPDDAIRFLASHRPKLPDGLYTLDISQQVNAGTAIAEKDGLFKAPSFRCAVCGPRFVFQANEILEEFPPRGSRGDYFDVLPHVILERSTIPWERSACGDDAAAKPSPPWLALLVFRAGEIDAIANVPVDELRQVSGSNPQRPGLAKEPGDPQDGTATVIDVKWRVLKEILPRQDELTLLTHCRAVVYFNDRGSVPETRAVVVANRLPDTGRISVHLVSVEDMFKSRGTDLEFFYPGSKNEDLDDTIRLVSLHSWEFYCQEDPHGHFRHVMSALDAGPLRLPIDDIRNQGAASFLRSGFLPLRHRFRNGDSSVSWYHGPLVPSGTNGPLFALPATTGRDVFHLPARSSDQLLIVNRQDGLLDVSYAAAWQLGRLLILQNMRVALTLFNFRRERALDAAAARDGRREFTAHHARIAPIDPEGATRAAEERAARWKLISDWFETELMLLEGVPFSYLVPDERMLPKESLRFFTVDPLWIRCLCDGAFSIGRMATADLDADRTVLDGTDAQFRLPPVSVLSGLLLRSAAVEGFAGMSIDGYSERLEVRDEPLGEKALALRLAVVRREQLSPSVLAVIFRETLRTVDFHLNPEAVHFGVTLADDEQSFHKILRRGASSSPVLLGPFSFRGAAPQKVLDVSGMAKEVRTKIAPQSFHAGEFARQMIEGIPVIRFDPAGEPVLS